jgi:hypothetical protein
MRWRAQIDFDGRQMDLMEADERMCDTFLCLDLPIEDEYDTL